jgi:sulfhydrogenase subunit beta (sulfur reductase)
MGILKADESAMGAWVEGLIAAGKVIGVQARLDRFDFAPLAKASDLRLDYDVSLTAPGRVVLQPPKDVLLRFHGAQYESVIQDEPYVLLGVHPYDMVAINQMDTVFTTDNYDAHYMARREAATIVVVDPQSVSENTFAGCMGTATVEKGFDVLLTKVAGGYVVDARTDKGEALVAGLEGAPAASDADLEARRAVWRENESRLRRHELAMSPSELPALLKKSYDHPVWEEKAQLCFSCGSCVTVCPTCYCFDVQEDVNWDLQSGTRTRAWDGCMLAGFAAVAGGHKGMYVPEIVGECACVGCGRCITVCVSKIAQPVEVYNRLLEDN